MKSKNLLLLVALVAPAFASAQSISSGIFRTASDYGADKLECRINCDSERHKIKLNDFLNKPFITVVHGGKRYTLNKREIFGFRDCSGATYRFFNGSSYLIAESRKLFIYTADENVSSGKGFRTVHKYYFSIGAAGDIRPLTLQTLKAAFPNSHRFHDALDANFQSEKVSAYDSFHRMYKVNHLLETYE